MHQQNNQNFCPSSGSVLFSFQPSLLVYLSVAVKKQQLVTPYGRERRGCFEHLPAWTPPYAVEFACLLSLINEKSDALFILFQFLTCFSPSWSAEVYILAYTSGFLPSASL